MPVFQFLEKHLEVRVGGAMGMEKSKSPGTLFWRDDDSIEEKATEGYIAKIVELMEAHPSRGEYSWSELNL
eukprot:661010-Amphidinium_carterae.2